jgi:NAD(P)-dependent dehydrogenase (short-subunit alcohol dehydrogenase family)
VPRYSIEIWGQAMTNHSLQDQVAIVTGAGKGLGRAYALHLAAMGARVVVNNRTSTERSADAVVEEIRTLGGNAVANYDSVEKVDAGQCLVADALGHYGRLDIVIANAGIDSAASFHKQAMDDFERVMQINFFAVARLLHAAWPVLRDANYGRVLVSTSTAGCYGNRGQAAYSSSKAALLGLAKSLAIEGAPRGVLVNAIAPYAVTQMTRPWFPETLQRQFSAEAVAVLVGWLVSGSCQLNGKTFIAGAGNARQVDTFESETISLDGELHHAVNELMAKPCLQRPASASEEFEHFMHSL